MGTDGGVFTGGGGAPRSSFGEDSGAAAMRLAIERKKAQKAGWLMNCIFDVNQIILRNHTRQTGPVKTYYIGMDIAF